MPYGRNRTLRAESVLFLFARSASSRSHTPLRRGRHRPRPRCSRPHPVAGLAGRLRLVPRTRCPRKLVEQGSPPCPLARSRDEPGQSPERVTQPFARLAGHSIKVVGIEPERPIVTHRSSVPVLDEVRHGSPANCCNRKMVPAINYLAVVAALIASMVIGSVFYHRAVFGRTWMRLVEHSDETVQSGSPLAYPIVIVASFLPPGAGGRHLPRVQVL